MQVNELSFSSRSRRARRALAQSSGLVSQGGKAARNYRSPLERQLQDKWVRSHQGGSVSRKHRPRPNHAVSMSALSPFGEYLLRQTNPLVWALVGFVGLRRP